ncbi:MAG: outer membrane beta-barrel protein [Aureispira sp.]
MNKQLLLVVFFHFFISCATAQNYSPAFYRVGVETGLAISSFLPEKVNIPIYNQRLGGRFGFYAMHRLKDKLDLRTGFVYSLRGVAFGENPNPYNLDPLWNLHQLSSPVMLFYHLSNRVNVALGVELNLTIKSNIPAGYSNTGLPIIGLRGSCGYYITPRCRIAAYYAHVLNDFLLDGPASNGLKPPYTYKNIMAGISVSFEFHQRIDRLENAPSFAPPCPRLI